MSTYSFPVTLVGEGDTIQEAWEDAILNITFSPDRPSVIQDEDGNLLDMDGNYRNADGSYKVRQ